MKRLLLILLGTMFFIGGVRAQDEVYTWEWGLALGCDFYMGDANVSRLYKNTHLAGALMARYLINPHMAVKGSLGVGKISGDGQDLDYVFPQGTQTAFKRTVYDLSAQFEYNFWEYRIGQTFRNEKRWTPYITGGLGLTYAPKPLRNVVTMNIPLGLGVKYKIARRMNVGLEWTVHFSLSDCLDVTSEMGNGLDNPFQISGKGMKNKDSYVMTMLFLTYDIFPKCKNCNN